MRAKYYTVRLFELLITFSASYLAVNSFFHSFIYELKKQLFTDILSNYDISFVLAPFNPEAILPLIISGIVFIITSYVWLFGSRSGILSIYHFNLVLFLPEALSFSKLDWLRLVDTTQWFLTDRTFEINLITALVIMIEYVTLYMTTRFMEIKEVTERRGALREKADRVFVNQSAISVLLLIASFMVVLGASFTVPVIKTQIHQLLQTQQYRYILLGIISSIIVSASIIIYYREHTR
ncbi:MAG: hypothetical protein OEW84_06955 [Aigarchaeota archaeon]|nr:hypothetical protein [Aigarchaeota archaeon]